MIRRNPAVSAAIAFALARSEALARCATPDLTGRSLADYADALVRSTKDNPPQPEAGDPFAEELK